MTACVHHPDLSAVTSIYSAAHDWERVGLCKECSDKFHPFGRAYATGLGPQAHAEAQEAGRLQEEFSHGMKYTEERRYL